MKRELLYAYLDGELPAEEAAELKARLAADPALAAELATLRGVDTALDMLPGHEAPEDFTERVLAATRRRHGLLLRLALPLATAAAVALAVFLPRSEPKAASSDPFSTEEYIDYVWEADAETYGSLSLNELEGQILKDLG